MARPDDALTVAAATEADRDRIERLLAANDLPYERLRERPVQFVVGSLDGDVVAAGGLEVHDTVGLLRSVVVADDHRGAGYGAAVCDELEALAAERDLDALYLLTTTAAAYFEARGYERVSRDRVPAALRETPQFADQCPDSATCMRNRLRGRE